MGERAKIATKTPRSKTENPISQKQKTSFHQSSTLPIDRILLLQRTIGNQAVQRLFKSGIIQAKLKIGQPGDIYEQEADRVAEQVMRMPEPRMQRQAEEKEEEEELIQTKEISSQTPEVTPDLESRIQSLSGGSQPLSESARAFFEPRFGQDFSQVRIHSDSQANMINRALNARAFTTGQDIFFRQGEFDPASSAGQKLLAHELTHVVQQEAVRRGLEGSRQGSLAIHCRSEEVKKEDVCLRNPESLTAEQLRMCIGNIYVAQREGRIAALKKLSAQLHKKMKQEMEALSDSEIEKKLKKVWSAYLKLSSVDARFVATELYLYYLRYETRRRIAEYKSFPGGEEKTKRFGKLPKSVLRGSGPKCLDAFYFNLEKLYPKESLEGIKDIQRVKHILIINKAIRRLQESRRYRSGVPEGVIIGAVRTEMDCQRVKYILIEMRDEKPPMVAWDPNQHVWRSTDKFAGGLLTKSMEALRKRGMTGEKVEIKTSRERYARDSSRAEKQASRWLAIKILGMMHERIRSATSGNYFFGLSLHQDYHSVILRAEIQDSRKGQIAYFWVDQHGQKRMPTVRSLANEIEAFFPEYWPSHSTIWQFVPMEEKGQGEEELKKASHLEETLREISSFED
jgi:Domain of unknown function (DUF4157)